MAATIEATGFGKLTHCDAARIEYYTGAIHGPNKATSVMIAIRLAAIALLLPCLTGCSGVFSRGGGSDVPCLDPTEWEAKYGDVLIRAESGDGADLLFTLLPDSLVGPLEGNDTLGAPEHDQVYRYVRSTGIFEVVDSSRWDSAETAITNCREASAFGRDSPLVDVASRLPAGLHNVRNFTPAPYSHVVAVLATGGFNSFLYGGGGATGQHYHYLYSEITGGRLTGGTRLPIGGLDQGRNTSCWTEDERFVVYLQANRAAPGFNLICPVAIDPTDLRESEGPRVSDVPCFFPAAWTDDDDPETVVRREANDRGRLLITQQRFSDYMIDAADFLVDRIPHDVVYAFDAQSGGFELVDNALWGAAETTIDRCGRNPVFRRTLLELPCYTGAPLEFDGREIPVAGGTALALTRAPLLPVTAVLSTDGLGFQCSAQRASGQHYHRLYSELDGAPIGPALRLGVGGLDVGSLESCLTSDGAFGVYAQRVSGSDSRRMICVVPLSALPAEVMENPIPLAFPEIKSVSGSCEIAASYDEGQALSGAFYRSVTLRNGYPSDLNWRERCTLRLRVEPSVVIENRRVTMTLLAHCVSFPGREGMWLREDSDLEILIRGEQVYDDYDIVFRITIEERITQSGEVLSSSGGMRLFPPVGSAGKAGKGIGIEPLR